MNFAGVAKEGRVIVVYRGHVKNGAVVFEPPVDLPDGVEVDVVIRQARREGDTGAEQHKGENKQEPIPTLYDQLKDFIGVIDDLPSDFARNHDHYIHGTPKK